MKLLFKYYLILTHGVSRHKWLLSSLALLCTLSYSTQPVNAEGSRDLYPDPGSPTCSATAAGRCRANLEWRTNSYNSGTFTIRRRTLLKVYANAGEQILVGSSAQGRTNGDILIYQPNRVTGSIGQESIPATPDFRCSSQPGKGLISTRVQELAGPRSLSNTANLTGYTPCNYLAPYTGIYDVVFYGPAGGNSANEDATLIGSIVDGSGNIPQGNTTNSTDVAAWDVTVRTDEPNSTTDIKGRLFTYYFALFTGNNGRPIYSTIYPVTLDGYRYQTDLRGLDPNGFLLYGNQVGFFDSDGRTPLYHDVVGDSATLTNRLGNTSLALPEFPLFFNNTSQVNTVTASLGIPLIPTFPIVSSPNFIGTAGSNNTIVGSGGTFTFNSNLSGIYEIVIKGSGSTDFDPTNPLNRVLRGVMTTAGTQSVTWDGKANNGTTTPFPVGTNYQVSLRTHAGEYHFPLIDAENNFYGGPTFTLLNASNPLGNTTAFYDDRVYLTLNGTYVHTSTGYPNAPLCSINPPTTAFSNPVTGFNTSSNDRKYGQATGGNNNTQCNSGSSFGDAKGLDLWTFTPSNAVGLILNIVASSATDLRITKTHSTSFPVNGTGTYTLNVTNVGTSSITGTTTVADTLPAGLTFVSASGTGWTCNSSITCTRNDSLAANTSFPSITITVNITQQAIPTVTNTATVSNTNDGNAANNTATDTANFSRLRLVKRITRLNDTPFNDLLDDFSDPDDDPTLNWPVNYLRGKTGQGINASDAVAVKPGDVVEYTIYFLSDGQSGVRNVTTCDIVPLNSTFVANAYNSVPAAVGGLAGDHGIDVFLNSLERSYSNVLDADAAQFYPVNTSVPVSSGASSPAPCPAINTATNGNGAVLVKVGNLPRATGAGTPSNAYGFVRFRTKVK